MNGIGWSRAPLAMSSTTGTSRRHDRVDGIDAVRVRLPPEQVGDGAWWFERIHPGRSRCGAAPVAAVVADPTTSVSAPCVSRSARRPSLRVRLRQPDRAALTGWTAERVIGSIRDVTSEHLLEERLRQAQKMEAVGQLAGGVAHDFNNLLTVIGGHVFMLEQASTGGLRKPGRPRPAVAKHLAGITRATDRAASLTRQLLAFGRKQLLTPTLLDVNAVVEDDIHMMRPADRRVELHTRLDPNFRPSSPMRGSWVRFW